MPSEVRRLIFSQREIIEALEAHGGHGEGGTLSGTLSIGVDEQGQPQVVARASSSEVDSARETKLDATVVGAALVKYCLDRGIPIPKNASRSLGLHNDKLALFIRVQEEVEEFEIGLPDFFDYDFYG